MQSSQAAGKQRIAVALSQLTSKEQPSGAQLRLIFLEKKALDVLLDMVQVCVGWGAVMWKLLLHGVSLVGWVRVRAACTEHRSWLPAGPSHARGHAALRRQVAVPPGGELRGG